MPLPNGKTRWSTYLKAGMAMGLSPRDVDDCTMWEFMCALEGFREAHGEKRNAREIPDERLAELGIEGF
ncbi:hypothetical protein [Mesorhizobium sp. RMAD-H1]|uniref:hypothetical protein n=1 Tax=Mesorhizobium sp. RMAD-H1 TaxID=2587065 RepID=UPI00161E5A90|nr:hypothetical protein [Mesorhizobium sp. RMAD-H1]MBB2973945.1 hypothetical protein [Mesorhizobium sp. RMAD-H1]